MKLDATPARPGRGGDQDLARVVTQVELEATAASPNSEAKRVARRGHERLCQSLLGLLIGNIALETPYQSVYNDKGGK